MKEIIDKLSSYNIFNFLFPGIVFCVLSKEVIGYNLVLDNILMGVFLYYFVGLVISRIGSLILEPILKKVRFVTFSKYSDFLDASIKDVKIELLSETNNMYRTIISLIMMLAVSFGFHTLENYYPIFLQLRWILLAFFLLALFLLSYIKQTKYIADRVKYIKEKEV
jgi:hypothetical protein